GFQVSVERFGLDPSMPPPRPHRFVEDGDIIEVAGVRLRAITTPGHTPGSVSYWCEEAGALCSGDTLFRDSIGRTDFPGGSYAQEMESICNRLLTLPEETIVLPGHMDETTIGYEAKNNPFVREWMLRRQAT